MTKKQKLSLNTTTIRNLTDTELDTVAGGAITRNWKCSDQVACPSDLDDCNVSQQGSCAASCAATCAASCAATCAASCAGSCAASCGASCQPRCLPATERRPCNSWLC